MVNLLPSNWKVFTVVGIICKLENYLKMHKINISKNIKLFYYFNEFEPTINKCFQQFIYFWTLSAYIIDWISLLENSIIFLLNYIKNLR